VAEAEVRAAQDDLTSQEGVVQQWEGTSTSAVSNGDNKHVSSQSIFLSKVRVVELEAQVTSMNSQMQEQEEEANAAIAQWQESYTETDSRCSELEKDIGILRAEKIDLEMSLENARHDQEALQGIKSSLDAKISLLENPIDEELDEIKIGFKSTEPAVNDENELIAKLREELEEAQNTIAQDEDVVHQWEGMCSSEGFIIAFVLRDGSTSKFASVLCVQCLQCCRSSVRT
jgi:chromosome segregation ATPase